MGIEAAADPVERAINFFRGFILSTRQRTDLDALAALDEIAQETIALYRLPRNQARWARVLAGAKQEFGDILATPAAPAAPDPIPPPAAVGGHPSGTDSGLMRGDDR